MRRHCPGHHQRSQKHQALRAGGGSFGRNKRRASETVTKRKRSRSDYGGRPGGCRTESGRGGCGRKSQISGSKFQVTNQVRTSNGRGHETTLAIGISLGFGIWSFSKSRMKLRSMLTAAIMLAVTAQAEELPRKSKTPRETYPRVDVIYDSVTAPDGTRLRMIITKPRGANDKLPVVFVAGWLSCDSVEAPADTKDESGLVFRGLAQLQEFVLFRMDKQGVGDSEGVCAENDFDSELAGYRAAFRALRNYDFIDTKKIYILGVSNGGGFAPLVPETDAEQAQVRGYISIGGWVKTWFEHMLEIERRRFGLMGKSPGEVNDRIKGAATLYQEWLTKDRAVDDIVKEQPQLEELWPEGKDHGHLYGRPLAFYEQLQ